MLVVPHLGHRRKARLAHNQMAAAECSAWNYTVMVVPLLVAVRSVDIALAVIRWLDSHIAAVVVRHPAAVHLANNSDTVAVVARCLAADS